MSDRRTARPVSGEIMAASMPEPRLPRAMDDLVEADFEVLAPVPAARAMPIADAAAKAIPADGLGMLRGHGAPEPHHMPSLQAGPAFWATGTALVLAAFWISGGHAMVAAMLPRSGEAPPALTISDVASRVDLSGPKPLLFVDGTAGNGGGRTAVMPELTISVTGRDGSITRYNLGTSGRTVASGEKFAFSSRLDLPKNGVETVSVSFAQ